MLPTNNFFAMNLDWGEYSVTENAYMRILVKWNVKKIERTGWG